MSYSEEFKALASRVVPQQSFEYYDKLYKDMLNFIDNNTNGEGPAMLHSDFYRTVWRIQSAKGTT